MAGFHRRPSTPPVAGLVRTKIEVTVESAKHPGFGAGQEGILKSIGSYTPRREGEGHCRRQGPDQGGGSRANVAAGIRGDHEVAADRLVVPDERPQPGEHKTGEDLWRTSMR